jgi:predicted DCC family thiol-disulfide oxidoreductase YuxK
MAAANLLVTLISSDDCHLCERARRLLTNLAKDRGMAVRELSWQSDQGAALVRRDGVPFPPALYIQEALAGYGRLSEKVVRRKLAQARP